MAAVNAHTPFKLLEGFSAETSGGLLVALPRAAADAYIADIVAADKVGVITLSGSASLSASSSSSLSRSSSGTFGAVNHYSLMLSNTHSSCFDFLSFHLLHKEAAWIIGDVVAGDRTASIAADVKVLEV
jgi:hypothetical protein